MNATISLAARAAVSCIRLLGSFRETPKKNLKKDEDYSCAHVTIGYIERMNKNNSFKNWIETFIDEKGIDAEQVLVVEGKSGPNHIPVGCLVEAMLQAPANEQRGIKDMIVRIDFRNGDVLHYFRHLAQAIAA